MRFLKTLIDRSSNLLFYKEYIPAEHFVFEDRRLVYISIPKVACTSIKLAIEGNPAQYDAAAEGHMSVHRALSGKRVFRLSGPQKDYFVFAFVRNPFDRLVSCYEDKVRRPTQHNGKYYFSSKYNNILIYSVAGSVFRPDMTFDEFVALVAKVPDAIADGHFKSQYSSLYRGGERVPQFVGRFEDLQADWQKIAPKFDLSALPASNRTTRQRWSDYYTDPKTIELVYRRFQRDFEEFGYNESYEDLLSNVGSQ